ncbi:hypothetical protein BH23ACT5_BH23ACT5_12850 [soil metagenome]
MRPYSLVASLPFVRGANHTGCCDAGTVMDALQRFTHLGRPTTFAYATSRQAITLALAGSVAGLVVPGDRAPGVAAFQTAATVFLAWALARELAPDHPAAAVLAGVLAGAATIWTGDTSVAALAALMIAARILVRSTGLRPLLTDVVAVGVFAGVFARTPLAWAAGLAVATAIALDSRLPEPAPDMHVGLAAAIGVAVTVTVVLSEALPRTWQMPDLATLILAPAGVFALATAPRLPLRSLSGFGHRPLDTSRLTVGRWIVLGALLLGTVVGGDTSAHQTWPAWAVVLTVGLTARRKA